MEEPAPTEEEAEAAAPDPEELAERIAKKYIEALPKPAPRRPIVKLLTWAGVIGLLIGGWNDLAMAGRGLKARLCKRSSEYDDYNDAELYE